MNESNQRKTNTSNHEKTIIIKPLRRSKKKICDHPGARTQNLLITFLMLSLEESDSIVS